MKRGRFPISYVPLSLKPVVNKAGAPEDAPRPPAETSGEVKNGMPALAGRFTGSWHGALVVHPGKSG